MRQRGAKRGKWAILLLGAVAAALAFGPAAPAFAHAFGQRYDLPVPLGLYLFGAGAAVVVSFVVIGVFLSDIRWSQAYPRVNLLHHPLGRLAAHPFVVNALKATAVFLFALVLMAGFLGHQHPMRNITPVLVWIVWWVGMVYVSAFVGDLWAAINPWRTVFQWAESVYRWLAGGELSRYLPYPEALGAWPAVVLLLAFAWVELVFPEPAVPANVATIALIYSSITWAGMFLYGREKWLKHGEAFSLLFGILARFAPTEIRVSKTAICDSCELRCLDGDGQCVNCTTCFDLAAEADREWALRPYAVGLLRNDSVPASVMAFVLLVLSVVLYDGLLATPGWARFEDLALANLATPGDLSRLGFRTFGLFGFWLSFLGAYLAICRIMVAIVGGRLSTLAAANRFVFTLVPIVIAYHLAHYLSYLLIQGQYALPLASDPFGYGWDLFGTAGDKVNIAVVGARFAWYLAVSAIVIGHIIAVYLAHVVAMTTFDDRRRALGSQYPMTALMVAFTITSLSILAEPIVQRPSAGAETVAMARAAMPVPEDAVLPEPGSGLLKPVGPGRFAQVGLRYGAMASIFHDGTRVSAADVLYPFSFAYRWGVKDAMDTARYDPEIDRSTALMRRRLAGVRVMGVDKSSKSIRIGDFAFVREMVVVEVYVNKTMETAEEAAVVAPPWSSVPWHVLALMEEAVDRGWAAFSETGAARSGAPWLDLARSPALNEKLGALVVEFAAQGFVPQPIKHLVTGKKARKRWTALKAFFEENGHFLVTNGPYRLAAWSGDATVLKVFRDISYPLGVGSYDAYAIPRRAAIAGIEARDGSLRVTAEIEKVEKFGRQYKIVRETVTSPRALEGDTLECRYLVISADGTVRRASQGTLDGEGSFRIDLDKERLASGDYTILVTLILNGNMVDPAIRAVPMQVR